MRTLLLILLLLAASCGSDDCRKTGCSVGQVCVERRADEVMITSGPFNMTVWVCEGVMPAPSP